LAWLRDTHQSCDLTMSVCTGAFLLARSGLLTGKSATTHHEFYDAFESEFAEINLKRGVRFVEQDRLASAGGLTSGIDLALHVVERYFGRAVARQTAYYMEYEGTSWVKP
jgi:transcriptional regulator GlxA family with amidase domain